jgi:predicted esterase
MKEFINKKVKINVLGFSQGTATVCRWLMNKGSKADNLILWAGAFPDDIRFDQNKDLLNSLKTYLVVGDEDEFINESLVEKYKLLLNENSVAFEMIRFKGKHEVDQKTLISLRNKL